ncbi:MAG: hypothetical protein AMXMBFR23_04690 [Chloroflexota bacterium]
MEFLEGGDGTLAGRAYWNHRHALAERAPRLRALARTIDSETSLNLPQWGQLTALMLEYQPDLVIELGRAKGNSTSAFADVAVTSGARILSICRTKMWAESVKRLEPLTDAAWHSHLDIRRGNITGFPFAREVGDAKRVLVFWDAHGMQVAGAVLGSLLPAIADREHVVMMHDISDTRYDGPGRVPYNGRPLWDGTISSPDKFRIGYLESSVSQTIGILDFCTRNRMPLHSADHSIHEAIEAPGRAEEMRALIGDLYSPRAHWSWFTAAEAQASPVSYPSPHFARPSPKARLKRVARAVLGWD